MILGVVEGLTEFLPVSSTGHLILAGHAMGLTGAVMDSFEVVIQAGALLAVVWVYRERVAQILAGLFGGSAAGRRLLLKLTVAFVPAAALGLIAHEAIKEHLFGPRPVAVALIAGGAAILVIERFRRRIPTPAASEIDALPVMGALWIGLAQCLSLWPGTSRAMTTMLAGLLVGLSPVAAAEFSFLLALPTLGTATLFDLVKSHRELTGPELGGPGPLIVGLLTAAVVAVIAIRVFLRYVTSRGLTPFGWYRIVVGVAVIVFLWRAPAGPGAGP